MELMVGQVWELNEPRKNVNPYYLYKIHIDRIDFSSCFVNFSSLTEPGKGNCFAGETIIRCFHYVENVDNTVKGCIILEV